MPLSLAPLQGVPLASSRKRQARSMKRPKAGDVPMPLPFLSKHQEWSAGLAASLRPANHRPVRPAQHSSHRFCALFADQAADAVHHLVLNAFTVEQLGSLAWMYREAAGG